MEFEEKIWVQIETHKHTGNITSYRGCILLADLNNWVAGTLTKKCIKIENTYWVEDESWTLHPDQENQAVRSIVYRILGHDNGQFNSFTGDLYLIAEDIVLIYTLKDEMERKQFVQSKTTNPFH